MGDTYYDRLGVSRTASTEEIEAAYRERLKETHPDVSDDRAARDDTRRLIEAKETLTDEAERKRYDRLGHDRYVAVEGATPTDDAGGDARASGRSTSGNAGGSTGSRRSKTGQSTHAGSSDWATGSGGASADGRASQASGSRTSSAGASTDEAASGASWYDSSGSSGGAGGHQRRSHGRGDSAPGETAGGGDATWRAWNTDATYSVRRDSEGFASWGLTSDGPQLLLIATLFVYPILLFGALYPRFPLFLRGIIGVCILLTVAYLQSQPGVGIIVFGVWSLALPIALLASGVGLFTLASFVALLAVVLPLGLSVLTMFALRTVSI